MESLKKAGSTRLFLSEKVEAARADSEKHGRCENASMNKGPADLVDLAAFRRLGARSMIAVPLLNRMKMADGAFDWDGYALVGIAPGLYKKETGGRREGSCAVRWQSLQENFPATCWRRIQVWVRRDSKAKADWRQRGP